MLINLFNTVKSSGVPCSLRELLDLIGALEARIAYSDMNDFYYLSRAILVKDEKHYDKFDRAFEIYFKGMEKLEDIFAALIPEDWLRKEFEKQLTEEELKEMSRKHDSAYAIFDSLNQLGKNFLIKIPTRCQLKSGLFC